MVISFSSLLFSDRQITNDLINTYQPLLGKSFGAIYFQNNVCCNVETSNAETIYLHDHVAFI